MVGGVATNLNGYQRSTEDVDVVWKETKVNRRTFIKPMKLLGENYYMINTMQIVPGWTYLYLNNGYKLDLMVNMKGLEGYSFEQCLKLAGVADIDGVLVPFLHINHLIANKKAVNRPKDQLDVIYLERIKEIQQNEGL